MRACEGRVTTAAVVPGGLWSIRAPQQIYLTTLTSTKLGAGPASIATPYVPDLHHFRGSYGAKDVIPLYRDRRGKEPNITSGLLGALAAAVGADIEPEHLLAYVYGLTATAAFTDRFSDELGEAAGPVRIPITVDPELFDEVVALGKELLWLHTWGERFADGSELPAPRAKEIIPISGGYPEKYRWDAGSGTLTVGNGSFGRVNRAVWKFEVSGLKVLQSWLGNRQGEQLRGEGPAFGADVVQRAGLLALACLHLAILEQTVDLTPKAADLLQRVMTGDLVDPATLPMPIDAEREAPKG